MRATTTRERPCSSSPTAADSAWLDAASAKAASTWENGRFGAEPGQQELLSLFGIGGLIELVTGLLLILGLFTRPAALIASGQMAVAYWMFHFPRDPYPAVNGGDAAILFCFVFLYIFTAGPGAWSIDDRNERRF